jgi:hypothetical protein
MLSIAHFMGYESFNGVVQGFPLVTPGFMLLPFTGLKSVSSVWAWAGTPGLTM